MNRDFNLTPHGAGKSLVFSWDDETGVVTGPDADYVVSTAQFAKERGSITSHPWPSTYYVTDPLHSLSDMAAVLGRSWHLTEELARHHPAPPGDSCQGFDAGGADLEPLY